MSLDVLTLIEAVCTPVEFVTVAPTPAISAIEAAGLTVTGVVIVTLLAAECVGRTVTSVPLTL
jgi:hypothetical protein